MCEVLDRIEARGEERGAFLVMYGLVSDGVISVKEAVKRLGIESEKIRCLWGSVDY